jgi:hypothetical protein
MAQHIKIMQNLSKEFDHIGKVRVSYGFGNQLIKIEKRVKHPKTFLKPERVEWKTVYAGFADVLRESLSIYDDLKKEAEPTEKTLREQQEREYRSIH